MPFISAVYPSESYEDVAEVEKCIIETNGEYAECVDHLLETMEESK